MAAKIIGPALFLSFGRSHQQQLELGTRTSPPLPDCEWCKGVEEEFKHAGVLPNGWNDIRVEDIDPSLPRPARNHPSPSAEERLEWFAESNAPIDAISECSGWLCFQEEDEDS